MSKVAVFGAGSWGTAFSLVLADAGHDVTLWARREDVCADDQREAREPRLPPRHRAARRRSRATHDPEEALPGADLGGARRAVADAAGEPRATGRPACPDDAVLVSLMKGVELGTPQADERGDRRGHRRRPRADRRGLRAQPGPGDRAARAGGQRGRLRRRGRSRQRLRRRCPLAVRSGPTPAPTWSAASSAAPTRTSSRWPSGWRSGSGFGDNTTASVITRGLAETARLAVKFGADPMTLMGLAGLGDLVPPARRRCRATGPSARSSARA